MLRWRCAVWYQGDKTRQWARESLTDRKRAGKSGRYVSVLNCASEKGLSFETWGREWVLVTPRSASSNATGLDVIDEPRSAWRVRAPGAMPWRAQVSAMSFCASRALSRWATIQPTT